MNKELKYLVEKNILYNNGKDYFYRDYDDPIMIRPRSDDELKSIIEFHKQQLNR